MHPADFVRIRNTGVGNVEEHVDTSWFETLSNRKSRKVATDQGKRSALSVSQITEERVDEGRPRDTAERAVFYVSALGIDAAAAAAASST